MPHTDDADKNDEYYRFMAEKRKALVSGTLWLMFICLTIIGLILLLPKF